MIENWPDPVFSVHHYGPAPRYRPASNRKISASITEDTFHLLRGVPQPITAECPLYHHGWRSESLHAYIKLRRGAEIASVGCGVQLAFGQRNELATVASRVAPEAR